MVHASGIPAVAECPDPSKTHSAVTTGIATCEHVCGNHIVRICLPTEPAGHKILQLVQLIVDACTNSTVAVEQVRGCGIICICNREANLQFNVHLVLVDHGGLIELVSNLTLIRTTIV